MAISELGLYLAIYLPKQKYKIFTKYFLFRAARRYHNSKSVQGVHYVPLPICSRVQVYHYIFASLLSNVDCSFLMMSPKKFDKPSDSVEISLSFFEWESDTVSGCLKNKSSSWRSLFSPVWQNWRTLLLRWFPVAFRIKRDATSRNLRLRLIWFASEQHVCVFSTSRPMST